ncbi:Putative uncharacterized protein [Moritella viscosa]|uniref:Uncharacterized protein n=1 Tax=Moritella viscosa TaxID=80854 RepID=A0A1L0BC65_9GAMM|nr:Putative uncharacterized protein [Moritella viscosa]SGY99494.1 Putative uncharacterized protein [Moritella viscosa]SGY99974.1 Putative uncharacterized protein [Moritella viscosa]SGZ05998.1 Putative uncharacterized protein [Moritella viscosa]SGZ06148.1 Putative uncharacterized protein [Moritella viscosa]
MQCRKNDMLVFATEIEKHIQIGDEINYSYHPSHWDKSP